MPDYILERFKPDPPNQMSTSFYPKLGPYSSSDTEVIENHMKQIVSAHIVIFFFFFNIQKICDSKHVNKQSLNG